MGFLESVKQTFNIAGTEVCVQTEDDVYSQCDVVTGKILIQGGQYDQDVQSIRLELKEFWTEARSTGKSTTTVTVYKTHETVDLAGAGTIERQSEHSYEFEVRLPPNARVSTKSTGWLLKVRLDVPKAIDPSGDVKLTVEPAEELLAIVQACESSLRFEESLRHRRWDAKTSATHFRLLPPDVLKSELDYLRLELMLGDDGSVNGTLVFDLQEKSIGDYFKALLNRDQVKRPLHLTREQIFTNRGDPNSQAISKVIGDAMQEVVQERR
ncbi:MAG: sporulation protein [Planctomycetes bacterium]|nr:sporulation protein [Planctomycetota bacterium]